MPVTKPPGIQQQPANSEENEVFMKQIGSVTLRHVVPLQMPFDLGIFNGSKRTA
jgi:hypothetical protein